MSDETEKIGELTVAEYIESKWPAVKNPPDDGVHENDLIKRLRLMHATNKRLTTRSAKDGTG